MNAATPFRKRLLFALVPSLRHGVRFPSPARVSPLDATANLPDLVAEKAASAALRAVTVSRKGHPPLRSPGRGDLPPHVAVHEGLDRGRSTTGYVSVKHAP